MENKGGKHLTSVAAFVEGGIQESCDDACSICLEEFSNDEPSTVTFCRHEFHLQCVLEWCQRSSQCPMCWQQIRLKDPTGQELFESIEKERKWRAAPSRNVDIYNYHTLRDFGLQRQLRMGVHDADFEEQILQNLAIVASMGRTRHITNQYGAPSTNFGSANERGDDTNATPIPSNVDEPSHQTPRIQTESFSTSESTVTEINGYATNSCPINQDEAKPSEFNSISDSLRSKLNAMSMRYKETISKGWKQRLFSRSSSNV